MNDNTEKREAPGLTARVAAYKAAIAGRNSLPLRKRLFKRKPRPDDGVAFMLLSEAYTAAAERVADDAVALAGAFSCTELAPIIGVTANQTSSVPISIVRQEQR